MATENPNWWQHEKPSCSEAFLVEKKVSPSSLHSNCTMSKKKYLVALGPVLCCIVWPTLDLGMVITLGSNRDRHFGLSNF